MNIGEANDTQKLLRWLLDPNRTSTCEPEADALGAAARLADRSEAALGAGMTGDQVRSAWVDMLEGCAGCENCQRPIETVVVSERVL